LERIVGGDFENLPNSNPWQILFLTENMGKPWLNCGGTLLTSKFVLSAAHCLPSLLQNEVIAGASNW
jgi:secreted trypsin-like serine protease